MGDPQLLLIGSPVSQSRSPVFQNAALRHVGSPLTYGVLQVDDRGAIDAIDRLRSKAIAGLNVTMPHKALAAAHADVCDERVDRLGAANTLWVEDGRVLATNTDVDGVRRSVAALGGPFSRVVILGAGGAAASATLAVHDAERLTVIARRESAAVELLDRVTAGRAGHRGVAWGGSACLDAVNNADLVVNATPLGMSGGPDAVAAFRAVGLHSTGAGLLDLIYAERPTAFLSFATNAAMDGATMLVEQGAVAFERWTGRPAPRLVMYEVLFGSLGRPVPPWASD